MATALSDRALEHYLLSDRFRPSGHVVWARYGDATVLLDAQRGLYYTLNEVGSRAWELLVAGEPMIEVLRLLSDEYAASPATIRADVGALLEGLLQAGLVEKQSL